MSVKQLQIAANKALRLFDYGYTPNEINDLIQWAHEYGKLKYNQGLYDLSARQMVRKGNIIENIKNTASRHGHIIDFSYSCSFGICLSGEEGNPFIILGVF